VGISGNTSHVLRNEQISLSGGSRGELEVAELPLETPELPLENFSSI